jgi:hypothetical protein
MRGEHCILSHDIHIELLFFVLCVDVRWSIYDNFRFFSETQSGDKEKSLMRWREMKKWKGMKGAFIGIRQHFPMVRRQDSDS